MRCCQLKPQLLPHGGFKYQDVFSLCWPCFSLVMLKSFYLPLISKPSLKMFSVFILFLFFTLELAHVESCYNIK